MLSRKVKSRIFFLFFLSILAVAIIFFTLKSLKENVVYLLWGAFAQKKEVLIDVSKHFILKTTHPSPFSAHKGFLGSKHFSSTNVFLLSKNKSIIEW